MIRTRILLLNTRRTANP